MHKIDSQEITSDNYSFDPEPDKPLIDLPLDDYIRTLKIKERAVEDVEWLRKKYKETGDKRYWRLLIQVNPDGWLQKRTWTGNYQNLRNQFFARRFHKQIEWQKYCNVIKNLPYGEEFICYEKTSPELFKHHTSKEFNIDQAWHEMPLFNEEECSDIGWMLEDIITYINVLVDKYKNTGDERYKEILKKIAPTILGGNK